MKLDHKLRITEIFRSIQGESSFQGRPCTFVRLTGCHLRCSWCDSEYTYQGGQWMTLSEILEQVSCLKCRLLEVTGGEPLLQEGVHDLMAALCDRKYQVLLETSGAVDARSVDPRVTKIIDIKCPASGEAEKNFWPNFEELRPQDEVKFVVSNRDDFDFTTRAIRKYGLDKERNRVLLISPVHGRVDLQELASWILETDLPLRLQTQLHKEIWGPDKTGV